MLTLRPTGLSCPAYQDWPDYTVIEDGRAAGRVYEDRYTRPQLRWFLVNHNPAVTSALASGLLYLSQPTLAACVSTSRSCRFCCKSLKTPGNKFPARKTKQTTVVADRSRVRRSLPKSPVSLSPSDEARRYLRTGPARSSAPAPGNCPSTSKTGGHVSRRCRSREEGLGVVGRPPGAPLPPRQALALVTPVLNKDKALHL
jgi:hypothetical protein